MEQIKIKYLDKDMPKLEKIGGNKSDWIDLRSAVDIDLKAGEFKLIPLGVCMQLPAGYEAHVLPRSSTFKNFGIIEANSSGVIDNLFCGDQDQWFFPAYALRDTHISKYNRICQFRIVKKQPPITFKEVEELGNENRGGHGSSGVK